MSDASSGPKGSVGNDLEFIMSKCSCSRRKAVSALKLHKGNRDAAANSLLESARITSHKTGAMSDTISSGHGSQTPPAEMGIAPSIRRPSPKLPQTSSSKRASTAAGTHYLIPGEGGSLSVDESLSPAKSPIFKPSDGQNLISRPATPLRTVPIFAETQPASHTSALGASISIPLEGMEVSTEIINDSFQLPSVEIPVTEPPFSPEEGRSLPFSLPRLVSAILKGLEGVHLQHYLLFYDEEIVSKGLDDNISGIPSIFYAVATNNENIVRTWANYGANVNATESQMGIPLLAFAILRTKASNEDTTPMIMTLLSLGADASVIPTVLYSPCIEDPVHKIPFGMRPEFQVPKTSWCKGRILEDMAKTINLSQRYFLEKVSKTKAPTSRQSQVTRIFNATALLGVSHFLIGQSSATQTVSEVLISHLALPRSKPLVMAFTGPSGHGKTELAKRMGELLNLEIHCVDCTEMKYETDLFGPKKPYIGHELGSPLNNFLSHNSGRRCIVFLDELEKTTREVQNALLVPFAEGRYSDRRNREAVDTSQTIWIFATNAADDTIIDFFQIHEHELTQVEDPMRRSKLMLELTSSIKTNLKSSFGNPLSGRISVIVPFLPFSPVEAAVVAHKFVLEFKRRVLQSVRITGKQLVGHIALELQGDGAICKLIAEEGYDCDQGARSLQSSVESRIGDSLVRAYLEEEEQIDDLLPMTKYAVTLARNGNILVRKVEIPRPKEEKLEIGNQPDEQDEPETQEHQELSYQHDDRQGQKDEQKEQCEEEPCCQPREKDGQESQDMSKILNQPMTHEGLDDHTDRKNDINDKAARIELMRSLISSPEWSKNMKTGFEVGEEYQQNMAENFPHLFKNLTLPSNKVEDARMFADMETLLTAVSRAGEGKVRLLEQLIEYLEKMPPSERKEQDIDRVQRRLKEIRVDVNFEQNEAKSFNNILGMASNMFWGEKATKMMELHSQPPEVQAEMIEDFRDEVEGWISTMFGENSELFKEMDQVGFGGMKSMARQLNALSKMGMIHPGNLGPGVPDLKEYDALQYEKLSHHSTIRLLHFEDMTEDTPNLIRLRILEVSLDHSPVFNALSYVWGDHRPPLYQAFNKKRAQWRFPILCNGKRVEVTYNLFCCLRRLTTAENEPLKSLRRMPLWIDQLCINQSDGVEKGVQVSMMDRIYTSCQTVISWLGENDEDIDDAIGLIRSLNEVPADRYRSSGFDAPMFVAGFPRDGWLALGALLSRPYFKRAWIVQEVALAPKLIIACGDRIINWDDLHKALRLINDSKCWTELSEYVSAFRPPEEQIPSFGMRSPMRFGNQFTTLMEAREAVCGGLISPANLAFLGRQFDATQIVDKFFAMVGMAKHGTRSAALPELPTVSYDETLKNVALSFTKYHLDCLGDVSFLALVEDAAYRTPEAQDYPSWMPDPAAPLLPVPLKAKGLRLDASTPWRAYGDLDAAKGPRIEGHFLRVQAFKCGEVYKTAMSFNTIDSTKEWYRLFDFIASIIELLQTRGFSVGEVLWRTLTASFDRPTGKSVATANLEEEFKDWCVFLIRFIQRNYMAQLGDSSMAEFKAAAHRMHDIIFDVQTFGSSIREYVEGYLGGSPLLNIHFVHSVMDKKFAKTDHKGSEAEPESLLKDSLCRIWGLAKDDVFPSPERIEYTLNMIRESHRDTPGFKEVLHSARRFEVALGKNLHSRRLFITATGLLGLGTQSLAEDDDIWVLPGHSVPVVFRKSENGTFKYIGEAFVFGAMHGEAVKDASLALQEIVLE